MMIRQYICPAIQDKVINADLEDQYAFRPTGSTTSALVSLLSSATTMLQSSSYVRIIALDFSKAFDTVGHFELGKKLSTVPLNDQVHNWIINYIDKRFHRTNVCGHLSKPAVINASVVQGSAIGPVAYILTARDLKPVNDVNVLKKYADDTYLLVAADYERTIGEELRNIEDWASRNNLKLNRNKTQELLMYTKKPQELPPLIDGIGRVDSLNVLGVLLQSNLHMDQHVSSVVSKANSDLYALKTLRNHGLDATAISQVCRATLISKLTYASQAWD